MAWTKGQSGNPKGRPIGSAHVERCKTWAEKKGWGMLEDLANSKTVDSKTRLEAIKTILAYGFGRPTEHHEVSGTLTWEQLLCETRQ